MEPFMQNFWKWIVLQIPESWAPNAMTLAGLIVNVVTTAILMLYSPNAKEQVVSQDNITLPMLWRSVIELMTATACKAAAVAVY